MVYGVADARRRSLRNAEEGDRFGGLRGIDDRGKILGPLIESERANLWIAHTTAALVVAYEAGVLRKESDPVLPHRTLPFIFKMG